MTAAVAKNSFGNQMSMGPAGGTLVLIADTFMVDPPKLSRGTIDVTSHDSAGGAAEFISEGVYDAGEMSVRGHYVANSTGDQAMMTALTDGVKRDFKVTEKGTGTIKTTFSGIVTAYGPDGHEIRGKQTFSATIKVTGAITKAPDA